MCKVSTFPAVLFATPHHLFFKRLFVLFHSEEAFGLKWGYFKQKANACLSRQVIDCNIQWRRAKSHGTTHSAVSKMAGHQGTSHSESEEGHSSTLIAPLPPPRHIRPFSFPRSWAKKQVWSVRLVYINEKHIPGRLDSSDTCSFWGWVTPDLGSSLFTHLHNPLTQQIMTEPLGCVSSKGPESSCRGPKALRQAKMLSNLPDGPYELFWELT